MRALRLLTLVAFVAAGAVSACKETNKVVRVVRVEVTGSTGTLLVGDTVRLSATARDDGGNVLQDRTPRWSSSDSAVATVTGGLVQAVSAGSVTITATVESVNGSVVIAVNNPAPSITSLSPNRSDVGSGAFQLTVAGAGFMVGSVAVWNGQDRPTQFVSASKLLASIGAADVATAGSFDVIVRNPPPGGGSSPAMAFAVNNPTPVITRLSPDNVPYAGAAFTLVIAGTGFMPTSVVRWKGQDRATRYVDSRALEIDVSAADIATPALIDVTVMNPPPGGGAAAAVQFIARIPPPGPTISSGGYTTCAVRGNGESYCWGRNDEGQVGDGSTTDRALPTRVATTLPFVSIASGGRHSCALTPWGAAYCWGWGTNAGLPSSTPVAVPGGLAFVQLGVAAISCGVTAAGALYCWGWNYYGQIGDGTKTDRLTPVAVGAGRTWRRVMPGATHTCAIATEGRMYCWGLNSDGQLGDGTTTDHYMPAPISGNLVFSRGAGGGAHSCGVAAGGRAYCWGSGSALGTGNTESSAVPVAVNTGALFTTLDAGSRHTCGVTESGAAYCWGSGDSGQIGDGRIGEWNLSPTLLNVPALRDIAAGALQSCGISKNGVAYCWGERAFGALGDGKTGVRPSPVAVTGAASGYTAVTAGWDFSCGLSGTGAQCWGHNHLGQLGDGTGIDRLVATGVSGGADFSQIAAGAYHACARTAAGIAYCWGDGTYAQLGNGQWSGVRDPSPVSGGHAFTDISAGSYHVCGVTSAGGVMCWGMNWYGQLGDGTPISRTRPVPISLSGQLFSNVVAGYLHTCALTQGGQVYCWGWNSYGQLGDGTLTDRPTPVPVDVPGTVTQLSAGAYATCALTQENAAYCWGSNAAGELGTGSSSGTPVTRPTPVSGGRAWRKLALGYRTTCGITTGGTAYCWGLNDWGQAGSSDLLFGRPAPAIVQGGGSYTDISTRYQFTCAVSTGGAALCWGRSRFGELGLGIAAIIPTPAPVEGGIPFDSPLSSVGAIGLMTRLPGGRVIEGTAAAVPRAGLLRRGGAVTATAVCPDVTQPCPAPPRSAP